MAKQICFNYKGVDYTLEFTRKTVERMEKGGFDVTQLSSKPMTMLPTLFAGAFQANHKFMKPELIREIYDKMTHKDELLGKLGEMYNEPLEALLRDPEDDEGNVEWTMA